MPSACRDLELKGFQGVGAPVARTPKEDSLGFSSQRRGGLMAYAHGSPVITSYIGMSAKATQKKSTNNFDDDSIICSDAGS